MTINCLICLIKLEVVIKLISKTSNKERENKV